MPRPPGRSIQPYRGANGYSDARMLSRLAAWRAAGFRRVYFHGFPGSLTVPVFEAWARTVRGYDLDTGAAFGLGGSVKLHPEVVGEAMGRVFAHPYCSVGVVDAEGTYDNGQGIDQHDSAKRMGVVVRDHAMHTYILDQPWPIITYHDGFPIAEFSAWCDEHDSQEYATDFRSSFGVNRWPRLLAWSESAWLRVENDKLKPANVRPRGITVEGYGHDDVVYDLVDVFFNYPDANVWCEWEPEESVLMAMRAADMLRAFEFTNRAACADLVSKIPHIDEWRSMTVSRAAAGLLQQRSGVKADYKFGFDSMAAVGIKRANKLVAMFRGLLR
jgi:hypothetical protein